MAKKGEIVKPFLCECGETDPQQFTGKMKSICKRCHSKSIGRRLIEAREKAIEYKGGRCEICGYNKYRGALEFHHKNPKEKDPTGLKAYKLSRLFAEVDKCMLLCANCHREEHGRLRSEELAESA